MLNVKVLSWPLPIRFELKGDRPNPPQRREPVNRNHRHFCGEAVVDEAIEPYRKGRVRYRAGWWPAQCDGGVAIAPGETVEVIGVRGIALVVQPLAQPQRA